MADPTQDSFLWTTSSSGDGSASGYTQSDWSNIVKIIGSCHGLEGVGDYLNEYAATDEFETVIVDTGGALVDGKPHECTVAGSVACIAAVGGGNTRIDRIALRADWGSGTSPYTVRIVNVAGTDAAIPTAPSLTTTSETTYEIALWQALVDTSGDITLTDERNYGDVTTACALGANVITLDKMADNSIDSDQYVDGSIDLAHMSTDSVDDTKCGNRVPQFYRRQGGNSSDWAIAGSTTYTPTTVRMQAGMIEWTGASATQGSKVVTFPVAFSDFPVVVCTPSGCSVTQVVITYTATDAAGFAIQWRNIESNSHAASLNFSWVAVGSE